MHRFVLSSSLNIFFFSCVSNSRYQLHSGPIKRAGGRSIVKTVTSKEGICKNKLVTGH